MFLINDVLCQIFLPLLFVEDILPQNSTLKVVGSWGMGISISWYSRNYSLTLSCSCGPSQGSRFCNLKRASSVKNWLRICFVNMIKITSNNVFNMLKSWKMWKPLPLRSIGHLPPHTQPFAARQQINVFWNPYSTALTRNTSAACSNTCISWSVMSPASRSLLRVALVVKPTFSFSPNRQNWKR